MMLIPYILNWYFKHKTNEKDIDCLRLNLYVFINFNFNLRWAVNMIYLNKDNYNMSAKGKVLTL